MSDTDPVSDPLADEALDAEDYLLDSMGDAILLWEILRHPASGDAFAHFDALNEADPWAARESVAQLVEYYQQATAGTDAPADSVAELFLMHCTNATEPVEAETDEDAFLECLVAYDLLPEAGAHLSALSMADPDEAPAIEAKLKALRDRRDA